MPAGGSDRAESAAESQKLRVVLITNGLRPVLFRFRELPCDTVGVVSWAETTPGPVSRWISRHSIQARVYARLRGRRYASLAHYCAEHDLRLRSLLKSDSEGLQEILSHWRTDLVVTSGCPLVPLEALCTVRFGGFNLHPSALPAYRGADPLAWQVVDGVEKVGITLHKLNAAYDHGPIVSIREIARPSGATRAAVLDRLEGELGGQMLAQLIEKLAAGIPVEVSEQPADSPTVKANSLSLEKVGKNRPLQGLDASTVWDITSFYGQCPVQWLGLSGFWSRLKWKPVSITPLTGRKSAAGISAWQVRQSGTRIQLHHPTAVIEFKATLI